MFAFIASMVISAFMSNGSPAAPSNTIDKKAIKAAEDLERRNKRNLRGRQLVGIANADGGLGGIKNILGG